MARREFQFVEGGSSKFWAIELNGKKHTVQYGRIGTAGQAQEKSFGSDAEAKTSHDKLIAEKVKKGYVEVGADKAAAPAVAAVSPPREKKAAKVEATHDGAEPGETEATAGKKKNEIEGVASAMAETEAAKPAPSAAPMPSLEIKRIIHLEPQDWNWAVWRPRVVLPRPEPRAFDLEKLQASLSKVRTDKYGWSWGWEYAGIPDIVSRQEAHFWLTAISKAGRDVKPADIAVALAGQSFAGNLSRDEARKLYLGGMRFGGDVIVQMLVNLFGAVAVAEMMLQDKGLTQRGGVHWPFGEHAISGFRKYALPYLTDEEMAAIRQLVEPEIDPKNWPKDFYTRPSPAFFLASRCRMPEKLLAVIGSIAESTYGTSGGGWDHSHYHRTQAIVLSLGSPAIVNAEMRRLKLLLNRERYIRGWLATTEFSALDYVRDTILTVGKIDEATSLAKVMALVEAPEAAPHMLELKISSKAPRVAREWLEKYPVCAVLGLMPVAAGRGKLADAAIEHLLSMKRAGLGALLEQAIAQTGGNDRVTKEVLSHEEQSLPEVMEAEVPPWLTGKAKGGKPLPWPAVESLPPLIIKGKRLLNQQVTAVLQSLKKCGGGAADALLAGLRAEGDARANDQFAWKLFETWLSDGAPSKDKWAMQSIGFIGGDGAAMKITPMIREWPGESQHQRAVSGLDCLRGIGSDTALMCLNGIAQKLKFKGLKQKAMEMMEAVAADRKMTRAELEDRIVPDCDLDERGTRIFDFGPRQFRIVLSSGGGGGGGAADMKAMIKDADGKVRGDLPAPNAKDDAVKAAAAVDAWKLMKKQIKEVAKIQSERLEQAMVTGRRWSIADFESLLVRHPLIVNLVRLLVWGGYDAAGKLVGTIRVNEEQEYANEQDEPATLEGFTTMGIAHPAHLSAEQTAAWGQIQGDYEIVPPFRQLGRPVFALEPGEADAKEFVRWKGAKIPPMALVGILERLAWQRGVPQDAGIFFEHSKPFPGANVTAVVNYGGIPVGYLEGWEKQEIERCYFVPGLYTPKGYPDHKNALLLGEVDSVVISEVLKDMNLLASKAE